jgi:hypothetical protein
MFIKAIKSGPMFKHGGFSNSHRQKPLTKLISGKVRLVAIAVALSVTANPVFAAQATPDTVVGEVVTHPVTGVDAEVQFLVEDVNGDVVYVLTDNGDLLLTKTNVDDLIYTTPDSNDNTVYQVESVVINATTGLVETVNTVQVTVVDGTATQVTPRATADINVVFVEDDYDDGSSHVGTGGGPYTPPTGDQGIVDFVYKAPDGGSGSTGYGFEVCFPFVGCATLAYGGDGGDDGTDGTSVPFPITIDNSNEATSVSDDKTAISIGSIGGAGGDGYGNLDGSDGGNGGKGGQVTATNNRTANTSGQNSHGVYVVSEGGAGGAGGDSVSFEAYGGKGGNGGDGGNITFTNNATIDTAGQASHGIFVKNKGGNGSDGGDVTALDANGGRGGNGGNDGQVTVTNNGSVTTRGNASHGIYALSQGGNGGDGGAAGGVVADGTVGGSAGNAGNVIVNNAGSLTTEGNDSHAIYALSQGAAVVGAEVWMAHGGERQTEVLQEMAPMLR